MYIVTLSGLCDSSSSLGSFLPLIYSIKIEVFNVFKIIRLAIPNSPHLRVDTSKPKMPCQKIGLYGSLKDSTRSLLLVHRSHLAVYPTLGPFDKKMVIGHTPMYSDSVVESATLDSHPFFL
ncbi:hypothetical protein AVEN_259814-1 [Araneus ventricosus]|uniref:Uncharacterized protein n=1 Tax=Araneus ventricosus TaxID=182803 RepID=A0A4Y2A930_ARAVE|nr:hypothetical protein AVEN_259814-1 [Araneus ventricosus]